MARSRNIKPGFFRNEHLGKLDPLGRLLFAGLWTVADREGRLEDRPGRIKADVLPYDDCDVDKLLDKLRTSPEKFIHRYEVDGNRYIQINNWHRHQNPHKQEKPSVIPAYGPNREINGTSPEIYRTNPADSFPLIPDSLNTPTAPARDPLADFLIFLHALTTVWPVMPGATGTPEDEADRNETRACVDLLGTDEAERLCREAYANSPPTDKLKWLWQFKRVMQDEIKRKDGNENNRAGSKRGGNVKRPRAGEDDAERATREAAFAALGNKERQP